MDPTAQAEIVRGAGKVLSLLVQAAVDRTGKKAALSSEEKKAPEGEIKSTPQTVSPSAPTIAHYQAPAERRATVDFPTTEETIEMASPTEITEGLKGWLIDELSEYEDDLSHGLMFKNKPCDCTRKHYPKLHSRSQELIPMDPENTVYQDIQQWLVDNRHKVIPESVVSGLYKKEYPQLASQLRSFRKRVEGTTTISDIHVAPDPNLIPIKPKPSEPVSIPKEEKPITLEEAKKLAAEEAAKEVERAWNSQETK